MNSISQVVDGLYEPVKEHPHPTGMGGTQKLYRFANGFGASVVQFQYSYGSADGLWELAVLRWGEGDDFKLTYETPVTDDVVGYLTESQAQDLLRRIDALPVPS